MKNWQITGFLTVLIIGFLLISGCTTPAFTKAVPEPVSTPTPQIVYITVIVTSSPTPIPTSKKPTAAPTTMKPFPRLTYQIGETATNGFIKVTVNSKRFTDFVKEPGPGGVLENIGASRGQWEIVEMTIENIQQEGNMTVGGNEFIIMDNKYGTHQAPPSSSTIPSTNLVPGQKITGELRFQVTKNPSGVQLLYTHSGLLSIYFDV